MLKEPLNHLLHPWQGQRDCPPEVAGMEMLLLWGFHGDPLGTVPCQWRKLSEISPFYFSLVQPNHPLFPRWISALQVQETFFFPSAFPAVCLLRSLQVGAYLEGIFPSLWVLAAPRAGQEARSAAE